MAEVTLEINGVKVRAAPERTILEVVREQGLDEIPTLCHSPELEPYASCFLCVVEVAGRPNLAPACATRVAEGMKVATRNERIEASRRTALELLLSNHYADCVSPCTLACPAGVDCQGYLALAAMGRHAAALDLIRRMNPLPAVCGRVCVRKCEVACRRTDVDSPVGINHVKRFVSDMPDAYDRPPRREPSRGKSVGIVGSGPAGLTAAWFLGLRGYDPVIYEALPKAGGMLRYGIPEYRLPKEALDREIAYILAAGATLKLGTRVGKDVSLAELMKRHAAVFIAAGAMAGKGMGVEGEETTEGVVKGADFLLARAESREPVKGIVVVVGGGNTAMDAARTSWRLGADRVIILYRRTKAEMPADKLEVEDCLKEGVEIMELAAPVGIAAEGGRLKALTCIRMKLGEPDASGRRRPVPQKGSEFTLPCDLAVSAIGQEPVLEGLAGGEGAPGLTRWKTIASDPETMATAVGGLYAGGDAADDGPTVAVDAIRDGRRAAEAIHARLSGAAPARRPFVVQKSFWAKPGPAELGAVRQAPRREARELAVEERRGSFAEVSLGYEHEDAALECGRCLSCGCVVYDRCDLRRYADEYGADVRRFMGYIRKHKVDARHPHLVYDPNKCILCGRCIRTCGRVLPVSALGLVGRGFKTEMRPAMNDPLVETNCVSCGNCVDSCPTGALTVKLPFPGRACLPTDDAPARCAFCSLGCALTVKRLDGDRYYVSSSGLPGDYICRYGRFGAELFMAQRRVAQPLARESGAHKPVSLDEACARAAEGLKSAAARHGPASVGVFVSPELSNEELHLAARLAREGLGTNNVASLTMLCAGPESGALDASFGFTASTAGREALKAADLVVCSNTDLVRDHLVLAAEVMSAARAGAGLVLAGSSADSLSTLARLSLDPMRGRAALLWSAVAQALLDKGFPGRGAAAKLPGWPEFSASLRGLGPGAASEQAGVAEARISEAARLLAEARRVVFIHSPDRPQDRSPGDLAALANLVVLLRAGGAAADLLLPWAGPNAAGIEVAGADPAFLPGRRPAAGLPGAGSRSALLAALREGAVKAALVIGEDPMREERTASWFADAEFLAAMDWCRTETAEFADVVLPCSTFLESDGTRVAYDGRLLRSAAALRPPAGAQGWEVLAGMCRALGAAGVPASFDELSSGLDRAARDGLAGLAAWHWNAGVPRPADFPCRLVAAGGPAAGGPMAGPLTAAGQYKSQLSEVGVEHFRLRPARP